MGASGVAFRAASAVLLLIGFYILAFGLTAILLWIPYAEFVYAHHITPKLAAICIAGGLTILWAVFPRRDRFEPPGPQLKREAFPQLFQELDSIALATRQAMPVEVYLVPDVNAWVAQRGGILGVGSRRIMGLGLPLMRVLTRSQFRAVLAHEFGHYHGGDTRIGPWIYKTRTAIGRALQALGGSAWLQAPFRWYATMFLRITHAVSRRQEYVADELAARTVGAKSLTEGLMNVHKVAGAFAHYWHQEFMPVLRAGYLPPIADGFERFLRSKPIAENTSSYLEAQLAGTPSDPYDTHPPLKDRIAALARLPQGAESVEEGPAISLLGDVSSLERQMLVQMSAVSDIFSLTPINWNDVAEQVYVPKWRHLVALNAESIKGVTVGSLSELAPKRRDIGKRLVDLAGDAPFTDEAEAIADGVVGAALAIILLVRCRGRLDVSPGKEVSVEVQGHQLMPFSILRRMNDDEISNDAWRQLCSELGILNAELASVSASDNTLP